MRQHRLHEADIDDLLQEVRIRLWRALSTAEQIAQAPPSYLYRTAASVALDLMRRRRVRREQSIEQCHEGLAISSTTNADHAGEASELVNQITQALASLTQSRRAVVQMYLAGYHRREVAELLGWTEAKTRNLLYRGLADLRGRLAKQRVTTADRLGRGDALPHTRSPCVVRFGQGPPKQKDCCISGRKLPS